MSTTLRNGSLTGNKHKAAVPCRCAPRQLCCRKSGPTLHKNHLKEHSLCNRDDSLGLTPPGAVSLSSHAAGWWLSVTSLLLMAASPAAAENDFEAGHCKLSFSLLWLVAGSSPTRGWERDLKPS